jgi:hypothetical protein
VLEYVAAGDYILLGAVATIVVVMIFMLEIGKWYEDKHESSPIHAVPQPAQ